MAVAGWHVRGPKALIINIIIIINVIINIINIIYILRPVYVNIAAATTHCFTLEG